MEKKTVFSLGDRMLRNVTGYRLSKLTKYKFGIKSKYYPEARVWCMEDHVKPTVRSNEADQIILHGGTNDLVIGKTSMQI